MKSIGKLLSLVVHYKRLVGLNVVCNILTAIFTILTVPVVIPVFNLFFSTENELPETAPTFSLSSADTYFQYQLMDWIQSAPTKNDALIKICILLVSLFLIKNLFQYLSLFFIAPVRNGVIRDLRSQLFNKITNLPLSFFTEERKGDLIARMSADVQEVEWSILSTVEKLVRDPLIIIGMIVFMLMVNVQLTLFVLVMLLFTGLIIGGIASQLKKQSGRVQDSLGKILSHVEETLSGSKVIKAFTAEPMVQSRFNEENNRYKHLLTRLFWRKDIASPLSEVLGIIAVCVLFIYGAHLVFGGEIEAEVFLAYLLAFFYMIGPSKSISSAYSNVQKGLAAYERINHILAFENPIINTQGDQTCTALNNSIEIKNLSFQYRTDTPSVLKDINLSIKRGETLALVGSSGSGKSTLADLILRFYEPTQGEVLYDGTPLNTFTLQSLRQQFGVVTQQPFLFNSSIADNISFGSDITDINLIKQAARLAYAHDFIEEMPDGYNSNVGDTGQKLSGGQRQRIAIARAILNDPSVLILDEATSALDSESELAVQKAMIEVLKNRTAIVIAHRLSTIQHADQIVVLRDGEIVETGNHEQLLAHRGEYMKFVELQRM